MGIYNAGSILIGGGSSEADGLWQPHWGVDLSTYGTSGKIAILLRDDYDCVFKSTTSTGTYTVTIYDSLGSTVTSGIESNSNFTFTASSYSNPFPDPDSQNGHSTYVAVISADTGNLTTITRVSGESFLWLYVNSSTSTTYFTTCYKLEIAQIISGSITSSSFLNNKSLKRLDLNSNSITAASSTLNGCSSLFNIDTFDKTLTSYASTIYQCWAFRNSNGALNGTYSNTTSFNGALNHLYSIEDLQIAAPLATTFGQMRFFYSCKTLLITQSNFRDGSGTVLDIYLSTGLDTTARNNLCEAIGYWELWQWLTENESTIQVTYPSFDASVYEGDSSADIRSDLDTNFPLVDYTVILSGKTFSYINQYGGVTTTPLTAIGATVS